MIRYSTTQPDGFCDLQQEMLIAPPAAMACLWSRTSTVKEVWQVVREIGAWPGVVILPDGSGLCFGIALSGVVLGRVRWNGRIDLAFAPEMRDRLLAEEMASPDPERPNACRVVLVVRTMADVDRALWLFRLAYLNVNSNLDECANEVAKSGGNAFILLEICDVPNLL